ncbi:MAG TPA: VCBS repeat-containing protein, partial [Pyrinomonadaceae bacterium]|nr:VCBS repeat-containing protein [Pyrinomonadaceae bacterium]
MTKLVLFILLSHLFAVGCHTQSRESNQFRVIHLPVGQEPNVVLTADVNDDHNPDVLVSNGASANMTVYIGDGKGQFVQASGSPVGVSQEPNDLTIADLNSDGKLDVAIANHGTKIV